MHSIKIGDSVYGEFTIWEPVLIELINSREIQRLKGIAQFGMPDEYYHKKGAFSRYDHSIGVFLLLRRLGAEIEEQVAGLLHDVSHTAFSHVVDRVIGDPTKEDYQDNIHLEIIKDSEIRKILEKHGFNYVKMADMESFSLLETEIPSLCADRVDYTLRELNFEGVEVGNLLKGIGTYNGQIIFKDKNVALLFAKYFLKLQNEHWAGKQAVVRYEILSGILKRAMNLGILSLEDFNKKDEEILEVLEELNDLEIKENLELLKNEINIEFVSKGGIEFKKKFRYIDPEILIDGSVKKLSEISEEYKGILEIEKERSQVVRRVVYNAAS
jgi:uncharacterized protein